MLEAVQIDGFDPEDARKVVEIAKAMEGADPKAFKEMQYKLKELYAKNNEAVNRNNARSRANEKTDKKNKGLKGKSSNYI